MRKATLYALSFIVALLCALTIFPISGFNAAYFANKDFVQYWSAFQVLISGHNPYDPTVLFALQQKLGKLQEPMMNWNPPWALALLSPILMMPFETSAIAFPILQVVLTLLAVLMVAQCFQSYRHSTGVNCFLITICFPPLWHSLAMGQLGAVLLFGVALVIWSVKFGKLWPMAFGLTVLSIKFHLFFIFVLSLVAYLGLKSSLALCFRTAALVSGLAASAQLMNSSAIEFWIRSLAINQPFEGAVHARNWIGSTFYGFIRESRAIYLPEFPDWIPTIIFTLALAAASSYFFLACRKVSWEALEVVSKTLLKPLLAAPWKARSARKRRSDARMGHFGAPIRAWSDSKMGRSPFLKPVLVRSLPFSIFLAPLGWFFDFCVLLPYALMLALRRKSSDMETIVIILYNAIILCAYLFSEMHVQLFWVPIGLVLIDLHSSGFFRNVKNQ